MDAGSAPGGAGRGGVEERAERRVGRRVKVDEGAAGVSEVGAEVIRADDAVQLALGLETARGGGGERGKLVAAPRATRARA